MSHALDVKTVVKFVLKDLGEVSPRLPILFPNSRSGSPRGETILTQGETPSNGNQSLAPPEWTLLFSRSLSSEDRLAAHARKVYTLIEREVQKAKQDYEEALTHLREILQAFGKQQWPSLRIGGTEEFKQLPVEWQTTLHEGLYQGILRHQLGSTETLNAELLSQAKARFWILD